MTAIQRDFYAFLLDEVYQQGIPVVKMQAYFPMSEPHKRQSLYLKLFPKLKVPRYNLKIMFWINTDPQKSQFLQSCTQNSWFFPYDLNVHLVPNNEDPYTLNLKLLANSEVPRK